MLLHRSVATGCRNCDLRTAAALLWWACITCPLCHPPVETSEVRIREVRAVHTEWERCPSTTELRGPLQKSPSQGWPGHKRTHSLINKDTSEQSERSVVLYHRQIDLFQFLDVVSTLNQEASSVLKWTEWTEEASWRRNVLRHTWSIMEDTRAYWGDEVGCSGSDSGPGWRRAVSESLGEEGPHDSVTCEQQASTEQPQGEVELQTHTADVRKQQPDRKLNWSSVILLHV